MDEEKILFQFKTVQSNVFKSLGEAMKDILTDAGIVFTKTGVKICEMDASQTILVHLKLHADKFEEYFCKQKILVGANMQNLFKILKTMTNNDTLVWKIYQSNINILVIQIFNNDKHISHTIHFPLIDLDHDDIQIPPAEFSSIVTMPSADFQKICRDFYSYSDTIEIRSSDNLLIFRCNGNIAKQETIMGGNDNNGVQFLKKDDDPSSIVQGYYNLKHLNMFTKCTNLCNTIELYMKNDFPIVIQFQVGSVGVLKLAIAPKVKDEFLE